MSAGRPGVSGRAGLGGDGRPPTPRPGENQDALPGLPGDLATAYGGRPGAMVTAVAESVAAGRRDGLIGALDAGLAALAVEVARAVDVAQARRDPYGVATASRELRDLLGRLRLDPTTRTPKDPGHDPDDALRGFLAGLGTPAVGNSPTS